MKSIMSVESNDRRVNSSDNSIRSDYNEIVGKSVGENGRCEGRLPNTLTHSLTLSHSSPFNHNSTTTIFPDTGNLTTHSVASAATFIYQ